MQETGLIGIIGVVLVSFLFAVGIDYLLPARPKVKRDIPMIGIALNVTNRFFVIWIVLGLIAFLLNIVIAVLLAENYK